MKPATDRHYYTRNHTGGSALILAIVSTMLLFIIGIAFLVTSKTETLTVVAVQDRAAVDDGLAAVIERISTVLVDDLFGNDENLLNGDGDSSITTAGSNDEYYDYPGPDDPWLADIEPFYDNRGTPTNTTDDIYYWRHITDLYGSYYYNLDPTYYAWEFGMPAGVKFYDPYDDDNANQSDSSQPDSDWYWVANNKGYYYTFPWIVSEQEALYPYTPVSTKKDVSSPDITYPDEWPWGACADADGDGVSDSRWVKVPAIATSDGQDIYTAVRIIDNCGMININTAFRNPTGLTGGLPAFWDGSQLSHINLAGIISKRDKDNGLSEGNIQQLRYGNIFFPGNQMPNINAYANDEQYEKDVALRLLNPATVTISGNTYNYASFDIADEMSLRNRFFLTSQAKLRCGYVDSEGVRWNWQDTFDPDYTGDFYLAGRMLPYGSNSGDGILAWLKKASYIEIETRDPEFYNRRHITTTYSFDRAIMPRSNYSAMPAALKTTWENDWTNWQLTSSDWSYRPIPINDLVAGTGLFALPPLNTAQKKLELLAAAIWLGLPDDTIINTLPQFSSMTSWTPAEKRTHLACQLAVNLYDYVDTDTNVTDFNPPGGTDHYYGYEDDAEKLYISQVAVAKYDVDPCTDDGTEEIHYAIQFYNPGPQDITDLSNWTVEIKGETPFNLPTDLLAAGDSYIIADDDTSTRGFSEADNVDSGVKLDDNDYIRLQWTGSTPNYYIDEIEDVGTLSSLIVTNIPFEKFSARHGNTGQHKTGNADCDFPIWSRALDVYQSVASLPDFADFATNITAEIQTTALDKKVWTLGECLNVFTLGTMDLSGTIYTMPEFWDNVMKDPSDGNPTDILNITAGRFDPGAFYSTGGPNPTLETFGSILRYITVFNPANDLVDNNGNGMPDEVTELAIAGRINVNTAPWFVIKQLPWLNLDTTGADIDTMAQAIVAYRDKTLLVTDGVDYYQGGVANARGIGIDSISPPTVRENLGFANVGELVNVTQDSTQANYDELYNIRKHFKGTGAGDMVGMPDLTPNDGAPDDLEERDILFQRISNLATVRSDTFTAYILVRVGELGVEKRFIALFDRTGVFEKTDKPKLVALQPVPDPR